MDDPGSPDDPGEILSRPVPELAGLALPIGFRGPDPAPGQYPQGTANFRFWVAAEALSRGSTYWSTVLPSGTQWHSSVGPTLTITLDAGQDLNAFYDRLGLSFFHQEVAGVTVFSGESPDVACHELGHAVLDAIRPQLFGAAATEVGSFHEAFGDISAVLSGLQLRRFRQAVLTETGGDLKTSSRLSRMAEQLGWAIRQIRPTGVDPDCLRNAVNSFFYVDPSTLPPSAPATQLSSEVHSFSRVFTGAYFRAIALMFAAETARNEATLRQIATDAGALLVTAVVATPVVATYYSQVAANVLDADQQLFGGKYTPALRAAFLTWGLLSPAATVRLADELGTRGGSGDRSGGDEGLGQVAISGSDHGLDGDIVCRVAGQQPRFDVTGAEPGVGSTSRPSPEDAAHGFVEDLLRRGEVRVEAGPGAVFPVRPDRVTHVLRRGDDGYVLERLRFFCR